MYWINLWLRGRILPPEEQTPDINSNPEEIRSFASKGSQRLSKGQRNDSDNMVLPDDYTALESNFEASEVEMSGNAVILSPNAIKIERIPFSTYGQVRGYLK